VRARGERPRSLGTEVRLEQLSVVDRAPPSNERAGATSVRLRSPHPLGLAGVCAFARFEVIETSPSWRANG
jgi:hypothetical protein